MNRHNRKYKKTLSTLYGYERIPGRMSGNSTRQIDLAIQLFFTHQIVKIRDHYQWGKSRRANKLLFSRVIKRLHAEHRLKYLLKEKKVIIDYDNLSIELI